MFRRFPLLSIIVVAVIAGCSQQKSPPVAAPNAPAASNQDVAKPGKQPAVKEEPVAPVELVATADDGTAEATFQKTLVAFQEGRLDTAFELLPASYQADVQDLAHLFAEKMDNGVWTKSFELLNKLSKILTTKKTLILNLDNVKNSPQIQSFVPHWDSVATGMQELSTGEVSKLDSLKQSDVKILLKNASRSLTGLPLPKFGDVTVNTVKSDADTATLSYRDAKNAEPRQVEFVKVEGKWLPKSIATGWAAGVSDAKSKLNALPASIAASKPQVMQALDEVGTMLDQLQQARNAEEFTRAIVPLIMAMKFGTVWIEQTIQDASSTRMKGQSVHLVVDRELNDDEQTRLKNAVSVAIGDSGLEYEMIATNGETRCRFAPIPDADALIAAVQKHFSGASVQRDSATDSIQVKLK